MKCYCREDLLFLTGCVNFLFFCSILVMSRFVNVVPSIYDMYDINLDLFVSQK